MVYGSFSITEKKLNTVPNTAIMSIPCKDFMVIY